MARILDAIQSPLLLILIGIGVGFVATIIYITTAYASDVKRGVCLSDWYLSKDICCQGLVREGEHCENFVSWSRYMFNDSFSIVDFCIYGGTSVNLNLKLGLVWRG